MRVGSSKNCHFCFLQSLFVYETKIIMSEYVVPDAFSSTSKLMTLNSHFALHTAFRVESFSADALVLRHDCFKIHGDAYIHVLSAAKM